MAARRFTISLPVALISGLALLLLGFGAGGGLVMFYRSAIRRGPQSRAT